MFRGVETDEAAFAGHDGGAGADRLAEVVGPSSFVPGQGHEKISCPHAFRVIEHCPDGQRTGIYVKAAEVHPLDPTLRKAGQQLTK
jgi:hypothetical protein